MNSTIRSILRLSSILALTCVAAKSDEKEPNTFTDPEELFLVQEHGDLGFYGSELRNDRVYPLNWIAKMHPKEREKNIYRISRTGGWSRDSFLIVPQAEKKAFVIDWHSSRWNRDLGPRGGNGIPEDIIASSYFHEPDVTDRLERILDHKLFKTPGQIGPLKAGESGDDYPFLLIERFGPDGYEGHLITQELYHFEIRKESEEIIKYLEALFVPEAAERKKPEGGSAQPVPESKSKGEK